MHATSLNGSCFLFIKPVSNKQELCTRIMQLLDIIVMAAVTFFLDRCCCCICGNLLNQEEPQILSLLQISAI